MSWRLLFFFFKLFSDAKYILTVWETYHSVPNPLISLARIIVMIYSGSPYLYLLSLKDILNTVYRMILEIKPLLFLKPRVKARFVTMVKIPTLMCPAPQVIFLTLSFAILFSYHSNCTSLAFHHHPWHASTLLFSTLTILSAWILFPHTSTCLTPLCPSNHHLIKAI